MEDRSTQPADMRLFRVGTTGQPVTLATVVAANESDEAFCAWARTAAPGDAYPDGEGCLCIERQRGFA